MENKIYETPQSELSEIEKSEGTEFYVVSIKKFTILFMATFGIYAVYWFYRNWRQYKNKNGDNIWPVARGMFSIFFAHSLFERIDGSLEKRSLVYKWYPSSYASFYVIIVIAGRIVDKLSDKSIGSPYTDVISILTIPIVCYILAKVQGAINLSQDDMNGSSNSNFTLPNYLWCAPGAILWFLVFLGLFNIFGLINLDS
ncbi:MAG: hypothetical protein COA42_07410 [Alteromonadaceae bacterium]|nr:MAG: hypothetical protein COA42_07410 [Alteromonadaceae bacterium]